MQISSGGRVEAQLRGASIEVCTACNHRCKYCPVATDPQPQAVMDLELFSRVIEELSALGSNLRRISFNHYNEPFLDPLIVERVEKAVEYTFFDVVLLNTNLSITSAVTIQKLAKFRDRVEFNINLPTTDRAHYAVLHGKDHLDRVLDTLKLVVATGFRTRVNIQQSVLNGVLSFDGSRVPESVEVTMVQSTSRAGLVTPLIRETIPHGGLLGCSISRPTSYVHIGVDGTVFFCCEDYYKRYVLGSLANESLAVILGSQEMRTYLSYMNGTSRAPEDFICLSCDFAIRSQRPCS